MSDRIDSLIATRTEAYGDFDDTSRVCVAILQWLRGPRPHPVAPVEVAAFMVANKAARMLNGGELNDSPDDIDGYMRVCRRTVAKHIGSPLATFPSEANRRIEALPAAAQTHLLARLITMREAASSTHAATIAKLLKDV